ncbi:beta strand repeat-containing protein [Sporomusa aerivorans]|uniref:beta strand repeat-containing protein n=1 Tax=Sporomusa aerivorans TaxID=204936 RepID=UPI003529FFC4
MQRKWKRQWRRAVNKIIVPATLATTLFFSSYSTGLANPSGGTVISGSAFIDSSGTTTNIIQTTDKLAINWQSFNIAKGEMVNFLQPGASSVALNRVIGNSGSAIYGTLNANGKVFLINPNGILFARGSQVNVGSLVASTQNLTDSDFLTGKYTFTDGGNGAVVNQGTIQAADSGYVALLGRQVANEGVIIANKGSVALAAGNATTLDFSGDGLINLNVDQGSLNAQASNSNLIQANGGLVVMTAKAAGDLTGTVVNNSGIIRAQGLSERNGKIVLDGGNNGVVNVSGTVDASGKTSGLTGGTVKVLGDIILLTSTAEVDVSGDQGGGIALIGGAYQGGISEKSASATTVEAGATITADAISSGDGGQVVVWANDTTKYDGAITARGGANSGNGGQTEVSGKRILAFNGTVDLRAENGRTGNLLLDPYNLTISNSTNSNLTGTSATGNDSVLNASTLTGLLNSANVTVSTGSGGTQDGNITVAAPVNWSSDSVLTLSAAGNIAFNAGLTATGTSAGLVLEYGIGRNYFLNGNAITLAGSSASLSIGESGALQTYSLIHSMAELDAIDTAGLNRNYALAQDLDASGTTYTSALVGTGSSTAFSGTFAGLGHTVSNLAIQGTANYTGLFGYSTGIIRDVGVTGGNITNTNEYTGGLVGYNTGTITNSYFSGDVNGSINVGGLVGSNDSGTISYSHSSGTVKSTGVGNKNIVGGLAGSSHAGTISNSYSESTVTSLYGTAVLGYQSNYVAGGLVGAAWNGGTISNSYATGTVNGSSTVGGLVGVNFAAINNSYSESAVNATSNDVGGLVGVNYGAISDSHSTGAVTATKISNVYDDNASNDIGGLVGTNNTDETHTGTITNSYSTGNVQGTGWVGGLVGYNNTNASISGSYSIGNVTGYYSVGGLAGTNADGSIDTSHSEGDVTGSNRIGGLAGKNSGSITNSYSDSSVTRTGSVSVASSAEGLAIGGFVGYNTGTISESSSSGTVTSDDTGVTNSTGGALASYVGGLVGNNQGTVSNSSHSTSAVYSHVGNSGSGISTYYAGALAGKSQTSASISADSTASGTTVLYVDSPLSLTSALSLVSSGDISILDSITSTSLVKLDAGGAIEESGNGKIIADSLITNSHGAITLANANSIGYYAANSDNHDIYLYNTNPTGLYIYPITANSTSYSGIDAGTGNLTLKVDGSTVNMDSANGFIIANGLELIGPSTQFWLYDSGLGGYIRINTLAGDVGSAVIKVDQDFEIGQVGATIGLTAHGVPEAAYGKRALGLESTGTITQSQPIQALDLYLGAGNFELTNANNHVEKITTYSYNNDNNTSTVNVNYYDKGDILVNTAYENFSVSGSVKLQGKSISIPEGDVGNNGMGIVSGGDITLIADKDITIGSSLNSTGGDILLAAGEKFVNNTTSNTGLVANEGRYLVYSANPTDTVEGMTGYNKHYNQVYTAEITPSYAASGNWFFYSIAPVISVTPGSQSVTYSASPGSFTPGYTGLIDGDTATTAGISGTAAFNIGGPLSSSGNYTAGSHEVTYTGGLTSSLGYIFQDNTASVNELTVTPKVLTVTAVGGSKVYDGTLTAPVIYNDNRVSGDLLTVSGNAVFADAAQGTDKTVSISGLAINGTDAGNYTLLDQPVSATASILTAKTNEKVETAVKHAENKSNIQPNQPGMTALGTNNSFIPVEIVQSGVNLSGIVPTSPATQPPANVQPLPAAVQITTAGGQASGYSVLVSGQALTVTLTGANSVGPTAGSTSNLTVLTVKTGEGAQPAGYYTATGGNGGLTLAPTATNGVTVPPEPLEGAMATTFSLQATGGAEAKFRVLYDNGALSIHPANDAAMVLMQAGDSSKLVVATGILTAQQNLGATVQSVEAVYLH